MRGALAPLFTAYANYLCQCYYSDVTLVRKFTGLDFSKHTATVETVP